MSQGCLPNCIFLLHIMLSRVPLHIVTESKDQTQVVGIVCESRISALPYPFGSITESQIMCSCLARWFWLHGSRPFLPFPFPWGLWRHWSTGPVSRPWSVSDTHSLTHSHSLTLTHSVSEAPSSDFPTVRARLRAPRGGARFTTRACESRVCHVDVCEV